MPTNSDDSSGMAGSRVLSRSWTQPFCPERGSIRSGSAEEERAGREREGERARGYSEELLASQTSFSSGKFIIQRDTLTSVAL